MMKEKKVLFLMSAFSEGNYTTIRNLFSQWKSNNLFCASPIISDYSFCSEYYLLGSSEVKSRFFISPRKKRKSVIIKNSGATSANAEGKSFFVDLYKKIVIPLLEFTGLYHYRFRYTLSEELCEWISSVSPDYIYTSLGNIVFARFVEQIADKFPNVKLIIHGYDDWVQPKKRMLFSNQYISSSEKQFRRLLDRSCMSFATTELMSDDYSQRYGRRFDFYPNPVRITNPVAYKEKSKEGCKIVYIGKIAQSNAEALNSVIEAIKKCNSENIQRNKSVHMDVHTTSDNATVHSFIVKESEYINFLPPVPYAAIPELLHTADILLLPITDTKPNIAFCKYSFSTKASEYMSSGVPILYVGPDNIAMSDVFQRYKAAFCVLNNDVNDIYNAIISMLDDTSLTKNFVDNARKLALEKFDIENVSHKLYETINSKDISVC